MSESSLNYWVVIPAAGTGQRMQTHIPKQYLKLSDKTILELSIELFLQRSDVSGINVCVAPDDEIAASLSIFDQAKISLIHGGACRAQSVLNGLYALNYQANDHDWVLVHDAARPCLSTSVLDNLINEIGDDEVGGILAVPASDTLKYQQLEENDNSPRIDKTLDRSLIWQAQTPQMFRYKLLKDALESALAHNEGVTDEASALEMSGYQPRLIKGEARNIKITTPDDLALAEFLIK